MTIVDKIISCFKDTSSFSLNEAYVSNPEFNKESVRARIYENLGIKFEKVTRSIYTVKDGSEKCVILEGDGRNLDFLEDSSIDCIITDHPWKDDESNLGGNRSFAPYPCFKYELKDFQEKARVLKEGCFLVEILPEENASNFRYLHKIKEMAADAGLLYYAKVPWIKENFYANTGRKAKNSEDIMIFTKGQARALRSNKKKDIVEPNVKHYMSGASGMLPTAFYHRPPRADEAINPSEKPVSLISDILEFVTMEGEIVLDQFAGSGVVGDACLKKKRNCILVEKFNKYVERLQWRFGYLLANTVITDTM